MIRRVYVRTAVLILGIAALPFGVFSASFDCASAMTDVEGLVCADHELSVLDDDVADAYAVLRSQSNDEAEVVREQRRWLVKRNRCSDRNCIRNTYQSRLAELKPRLKIPTSGDCSLDDLDNGTLSIGTCLAITQARERREQSTADPCAGVYGGNPMMFCLHARLQKEEALVDRAFSLALRVVQDPGLLKDRQDNWRAVRDADCRIQTTNGENENRCKLEATEQRREQLYTILRGDCRDYRDFCIPRKRQTH